jgi:hypothetical protein
VSGGDPKIELGVELGVGTGSIEVLALFRVLVDPLQRIKGSRHTPGHQ